MNCFEWQNRSSDYLDGTLIGALKKSADEHLEGCDYCREKHKRYLLILSTVNSQPRTALPIPLRKDPFSNKLPGLGIKGSRARWQNLPWYFRTGIEGLGIAVAILFVIAVVPKIRSAYERGVQRKLEGFNAGFGSDGLGTEEAAPLTRGKLADTETKATADEYNTEAAGNEESTDSSEDSADGDIKVGKAEIWRFNLKTDSPYQMRPQIVKFLEDLKIPAGTPGLGGVEAPGGIQFDLFVPQSVVQALKKQLQKIAGKSESAANPTSNEDAFTWYKNKSKREIPAGKSRVVIWLSQM